MADPTAQLTSVALELASLGVDLYDLLELTPSASESEIKRAWRFISLKYHPDRAGDDQAAKEKYERCRQARDILVEPAAKAAYDSAREAEVRRQQEKAKMDAERRAMVDDLERRERAAARGEGPGAAPQQKGFAKRSAEEEERLRRAFARGAEIQRARERAMGEADKRERAREEEAKKKSFEDLDAQEAALHARLEEIKVRKAARKAGRKPGADELSAATGTGDATYGPGRREEKSRLRELEKMGDTEKEEKRRKKRATGEQREKPPPPCNFDPAKTYTLDQFDETLERLRKLQEERITAGQATRNKVPLEERTFDMPDGRRIRIPKYSFNYKAAARGRTVHDSVAGGKAYLEKTASVLKEQLRTSQPRTSSGQGWPGAE